MKLSCEKVLIASAVLALGCAPDRDHPPVDNGGCRAQECGPLRPSPIASPPPPPEPRDAAADSGRQGLVLALNGGTFEPLPLPLDIPTSVAVLEDGQRWQNVSVEAGGFSFEESAAGTWLSVRSSEPSSSWVNTLTLVPPAREQVAVVGLVEALTFEELVLTSLVLGATGALQADKAHVALRFVDAVGRPVSGVSVSYDEGSLAYDAGQVYSDALFETGERGAALLLNLEVPSGRSALELTVLRRDRPERSLLVWVAQGTVSFAALEL